MSTVAFLGDVWLPRPFGSKIDFQGPYIFNLESPVTTSEKPARGKINLKTEQAFFQQTFAKEPAAVCLANNHILDYGPQGLADTIEALDAKGIRHFGAGTLKDNCRNPLLIEIDGQGVALMGYVCPSTHPVFAQGEGPGVMPIDLKKIAEDIGHAKRHGPAHIIVHLHWGEEQVGLPKPEDVRLARRIIDLGADLIIGHHAHCIQPGEIYKGKHIFYGLGNAVFPDLRVPSFCDERGKPSRTFIKKQQPWNKRSLMVEYSLTTGGAQVRHLIFDRDFVRDAGKKALPALGPVGQDYGRKYRRVYQAAMFRDVVGNFFSQPKLPKLSHFQYVASLLGKKEKI